MKADKSHLTFSEQNAERKDIGTLEDIRRLVDAFYTKVRADELLGGIFNGVIKDQWPRHLDKMYRFWQTVLLEEHTYSGSPFAPHARLPVESRHFVRWTTLFESVIDEHFKGEKADEAKWRARQMAKMFLSKITYFRDRQSQALF